PFRLSISTTNTTLHSRALPVAGSQMTVLEASLYARMKNTIFRYLPVLRTLNPPTFIYNSWTQTIKLLHRLRSSDCPKLGKNTNSPYPPVLPLKMPDSLSNWSRQVRLIWIWFLYFLKIPFIKEKMVYVVI